ncbi:MAG: fibronectin type III domain-containing protein [Candidatus Zixiibacteriota bacterium]|nr:MAG: fibronectin type III domain-containing protein [candidate division Zixibacteria bacterium]
MKSVIVVLLMVVLIGGCSRHIDSVEPDVSLPDAPPLPLKLKVSHLSDGVMLTWQAAGSSEVAYFKVYYTFDTTGGGFALWDTTSSNSSIITGLSSGQIYFFTVSSVTPAGLEGRKAPAVSTQIGVLSLVVNNDDQFTNSRSVVVSFVVPVAAALVQLSEDDTFAGAHWESYIDSKGFTLSDGDEVKHVYGRFIFSDGSESFGAISDSIILDTWAEIDSAYFLPAGVDFSAGDTIMFHVLAGEIGGEAAVSFPGQSSLKLFDDGTNGDNGAGDGLFTRRFIIPIDLEVADGVVNGFFVDEAGNQADVYTIPHLLKIANPPGPVILAARAEEGAVSLSWTTSTANDFASYRIYRNSGSADFSIDQGILTGVINSRTVTDFTDTPSPGTWSYKIYVFDEQGLNGGGSNHVVVSL